MALYVLELLYTAVLFCESSLSVAVGLLRVTKSILELIDLRMQITDLSLYPLISIDFDAVDESGPGTLDCILNVRMQ